MDFYIKIILLAFGVIFIVIINGLFMGWKLKELKRSYNCDIDRMFIIFSVFNISM